ncbi:MAG: phosphoglycerate kinase, partial [Dehalococcoidia bacterium]|nr:phosphoglycerate kinase [Dehalococcoidia bacterium]
MNKKTLRDIAVGNKVVMVRADLNVPLDPETNAITDNTRIQAVIPTLEY